MNPSRHLALLSVLCIALAAQELPPLETIAVDLDAFSVINYCLPVNIQVEPSRDNFYTLVVEAEEGIPNLFVHDVTDGALTLGLSEGFETERVVRVTLTLPNGALERVTISGASTLAVAPGLTAERLRIEATGSAAVRVFNATVDDLRVEASGAANVFVDGIENAQCDVSGSADVHLHGLSMQAQVTASGAARVVVDAEDEEVEVTGEVSGAANVLLTQGNCDIDESGVGRGCRTIEHRELERFVARYTCGINIVGGVGSCGGVVIASAESGEENEVGALAVEQINCLDEDIDMF